jgi:hypothetical protein
LCVLYVFGDSVFWRGEASSLNTRI